MDTMRELLSNSMVNHMVDNGLEAMKRKYEAFVRLFDINRQDQNGRTALVRAVYERKKKLVERLLCNKHIDINKLGNVQESALIVAAFLEYQDILESLLKHKNTNVNIQGHYKETALIWAVVRGNKKMLAMLLSHPDIDVNKQDQNQGSALTYILFNETVKDNIAVETRAAMACQLLIAHAKLDLDQHNQLIQLARDSHNNELEKLVFGIPPQEENESYILPPPYYSSLNEKESDRLPSYSR